MLVRDSLRTKRVRLSVDPGLSGTGMCWWNNRDWKTCTAPTYVENLYAKDTKADWITRANILVSKFDAQIQAYRPIAVYCEFPEFMDSAKGFMVATKGDLQRLTFVVGAFAQSVWAIGSQFVPVHVSDWKGQLSKEQVIARAVKRLPELKEWDTRIVSHSWDALALGLWAKGCLHENQTTAKISPAGNS